MQTDTRGISPVVGVILMVAVTVILSATVGIFVFNLGAQSTQQQQATVGVSAESPTDGQFTIQVVTGSADTVQLLVNGAVRDTLTNVSAGQTLSAPTMAGDRVTVVSVTDGSRQVVTTYDVTTGPSLPNGSLIRWAFSEPAGATTAYDASGHGYHAEINTSTQTGVTGFDDQTAFRFNGRGRDYVRGNTSLLNGVETFTVTLWVNPASLDYTDDGHFANHSHLIGRQGASSDDSFEVGLINTSAIGLYVDDGSDGHLQGGTVPTAAWSHVTAVYNGSSGVMRIYVNGSQVAMNASVSSGPTVTNDHPLAVGSVPGSNYGGQNFTFDGRIQRVIVYDRALNASEVEAVYQATR